MNRPLRVLIASHACATPQNQRLFQLAAEQREWRVTLCLPRMWRDEYGNHLPARLLNGFDAELITLPVLRNGSVPLHAYRGFVSRALRQASPDLVYSHNEAYAISSLQWCWANERTVRRPFGFFSCQNICKAYPPPFRQFETWVLRKSSFFFPITHDVEQVHRQKGYVGSSTVLPLGYDADIYRPTIDVATRHAKRSGHPLKLLYIGRLVEEKGLITLARALGQLRDCEWKLTIAGTGPYEAEFRVELQRQHVLNRVEWLGFVDRGDVPTIFEQHDVMVLPSETRPNWKEQFGRVIIESLACGTPVIGSDSGEIPNLIRETQGGLVFAEGIASVLAASIREFMSSAQLRPLMAARAQQYVENKYSLQSLASRFADAIEAATHPQVAH